jgi:hypothetical protein
MDLQHLYITTSKLATAFDHRIFARGLPLLLVVEHGKWYIRPTAQATHNWQSLARIHLSEEFDNVYP